MKKNPWNVSRYNSYFSPMVRLLVLEEGELIVKDWLNSRGALGIRDLLEALVDAEDEILIEHSGKPKARYSAAERS